MWKVHLQFSEEGEWQTLSRLTIINLRARTPGPTFKEPLSKTKEIWSETGYIKWDQRNAVGTMAQKVYFFCFLFGVCKLNWSRQLVFREEYQQPLFKTEMG